MATQVRVDFGTLKNSVSMGALLDRYGIRFRQNGNELRSDCPFPSHDKKQAKGSFAVGIAENKWYCHFPECRTVSGFPKGGDAIDFVVLMEGFSGKGSALSAAKKLLEWFPQSGSTPKPVEVPKPIPVPEENKPLNFELKGIAYHPYLEARGVSADLASKFGVGFFPGKGSMSGRIVFPIRDEKGQLVAYAGRSIDNSEPKYRLPVGFHKSLVLYNRHAVKGDALTIVEGFVATMKVTDAGFPCVGLMGCTLSNEQERLLQFKFITLMLDPDEAGQTATKEIALRLAQNHYVRIARNEKPPDEMTAEEIKNTLRYTCPILTK